MATTYLSRTQTTGNRRTWTFSAWVKRCTVSSYSALINATTTDEDTIRFRNDNKIQIFFNGTTSGDIETTAVYRDPNAYYHVVLAVDTTQAIAANRVKLYINGEQVTSFSTETYPVQDYDTFFNMSNTLNIGAGGGGSDTFDGIMSAINFADGTAYPASTFGSTDADTGEWVINTSPSFTLGTNGFTILNNGDTITDQSSNSNDFTLTAGTLTNTEDCPSDIFATLNPLYRWGTTSNAYNNGNTAFNTTTTAWGSTFSTLGMTKGKFYAEMKVVNLVTNNGYMNLGIQGLDLINEQTGNTNANFVANSGSAGMEMDYRGGTNNNLYSGGGSQLQDAGVDWTNGDIVGLAVDMDNKALYIHKNGVYLTVGGSVGDPTSGASKTGAIAIPASITTCGFAIGGYTDHAKGAFNFGNGYFETTAISSEGTNASGIGKFEYDVPTSYTALSTKGLNA